MQAAKSSAAWFNCWAYHLCCQYHRTIWLKSKRFTCKPNYCRILYLHRKLYAWKRAATLAFRPRYRPRILPHWATIKSKMFSSMARNYFQPNKLFNGNFSLDFRKMSDLSVDQLKTLTSIYELVCYLIHLNEHFLAQFCDSVYIIANDLLRHFLSDGNNFLSLFLTFSEQIFEFYFHCSCVWFARNANRVCHCIDIKLSAARNTRKCRDCWIHHIPWQCWHENTSAERKYHFEVRLYCIFFDFFSIFLQISSFQWIGSRFSDLVCVIFC